MDRDWGIDIDINDSDLIYVIRTLSQSANKLTIQTVSKINFKILVWNFKGIFKKYWFFLLILKLQLFVYLTILL